jgi:diguanylate cyclase (GGDEF)-like protein
MTGKTIGRIIAYLLAAIAIACGAPFASAQTSTLGTRITPCVLRAQPGMTPRTLLAHPEAFDCTTAQSDFGPGDYWVRSQPLHRIDQRSPQEIRVASLWQKRLTLYALYGDGRLYRFFDDGHGATRHLQLGAIIQHQTPPSSAPLVRLLWHVEGSANLRGILNGPHVTDAYQAGQATLALAALYAGFVGLCIALFIYNLALWGALRHPFQLAYCAMVLALMGYAISSSGALAWLVPTIANNDRIRINYFLLAASAASAMAFARSFFEVRVFSGWLRWASAVAMAAVIIPATLFALFAPYAIQQFDLLYSITFVGLLSVVVPILWRAWRMRSNFLWLFAIGWAAPIGFACVRILNAFHLIGWSFWLDNSTLIAVTAEALMSSLAIAYRIRLLSLERDEARIQEAAARLLADTDPLTGLLNRRAFLREAIGRDGMQSLLIADIDHFKRVNDTLGHDGGDEVLRLFARALRAAAPAAALVARLGGEEFAIVAAEEAALDGEAILARLRAERMPFDLSVTASIGLCIGPLETEAHWKLLYAIADRALFDAKTSGRDRARQATASTRVAA